MGSVHEGSDERVGVEFLQEKLELDLIRFRVWEFAIQFDLSRERKEEVSHTSEENLMREKVSHDGGKGSRCVLALAIVFV